MKTYLELEGKLGPKPQSQTNQFRPPLPNTNPQIRKESKMAEKRKGLSPTKKLKAAAGSNPSNTTVQPSPESAPVNPKNQQTPTLEHKPHHWKMPLFMQELHGLELERCLTIFLR